MPQQMFNGYVLVDAATAKAKAEKVIEDITQRRARDLKFLMYTTYSMSMTYPFIHKRETKKYTAQEAEDIARKRVSYRDVLDKKGIDDTPKDGLVVTDEVAIKLSQSRQEKICKQVIKACNNSEDGYVYLAIENLNSIGF